MDVVALSSEIGMRAHRDLDQGIAGRSAVETWSTLAAQAQYLPIAGPGRNSDIQHGSVRQRHATARAVDRVEKIHFEAIVNVASPPAGRARTAAALAQDPPQHVVHPLPAGDAP